MKYNLMSIVRKLPKVVSYKKKHKKSCGHFPKLLYVEPNNLVVSWGQICDNPLATIVWGQILSKENNIVSLSYLFFFFIDIFLSSLLCVIFPIANAMC